MLKRWSADLELVGSISVLDPAASPAGVRHLRDAPDLVALQGPLTVVLAVKPAAVLAILGELSGYLGNDALVVSVAAGVTTSDMKARLPRGATVIRAMPNTPAAIGRGVTVAVAQAGVSEGQKRRCQHLLSAVGEVLWLDDERLMNAVTAISGSGPAYFFRFAELLAQAGVELGLAPETAERLARLTLTGAGALAEASEHDLASLCAEVTSPGGSTAAALAVLDGDNALGALVAAAAHAAARRSGQLSAAGSPLQSGPLA